MPETEEVAPATEARQDAKTSDAKAEATGTATPSDELSDEVLDGVAGGGYWAKANKINTKIGI